MVFSKETYRSYPAVSSSTLKWILPELGGSPRKYKYYQDFPPEQADSNEIRIGNIAHKYLEIESKLNLLIVDRPTPGIAAICEAMTEDPIWRTLTKPSDIEELAFDKASSLRFQPGWKRETIVNKIMTDGGDYLTQLTDLMAKPDSVGVSKSEYDMFTAGIFPAIDAELESSRFNPEDKVEIFNEYPILFVHNDMECKALIDKLFINHSKKMIAYLDLKTTSMPMSFYLGYNTPDEEVDGVMIKRGVINQMAFYRTAIQLQFPGYSISDCRIVGVETLAPYDHDTAMIPHKVLDKAWKRCDFALEQIRKIYSLDDAVGL